MERTAPDDSVVVHAVGERFRGLIRTLVRGNIRRARSLAARMRDQVETLGEPIALQNLIEDMAQGQAFRNAFINI
ncbi:MAG TPA: hypothetical protein PLU54_12785, partial [Deltaproteobacteria bacterium]|nr:hypothetical protein [Deltaproteobacteria bacterium]